MLKLIAFAIEGAFLIGLFALVIIALHWLYFALCWLLDKKPPSPEKDDYQDPPTPTPYDGL